MMLSEDFLAAPVIDDHDVDLDGVERVSYLLEQTFRYDYPRPVERLRHRLVAVPPAWHGHQRLLAHRVDVAGAVARREVRRDPRGNTVVRLRADRVEQRVEFRIRALVERAHHDVRVPMRDDALNDPRLLRATRLTTPDARVRMLAQEFGPHGHPLDLATRICVAVHSMLDYEYGVTSVGTTAAEALAGGRGVCQDAAHIMLALCHVLALPARYVSGHLLGQGGTHAWVEVVVPDGDHVVAVPFDPCNGVPVSARYLTVATGRDYADVAPTSGSFMGTVTGRLTTHRRVAVLLAA